MRPQVLVIRVLLSTTALILPTVAADAQTAISVERRELASLRADVTLLLEKHGMLAGAIEALRTERAQLSRQLEASRRTTASLAERLQVAEERIGVLTRSLKEERAARKVTHESVIQSVAKVVAEALNAQARKDEARADAAQLTHVVARGDTLSAIAKAFDTTVEAIKQANKLRNDVIREGQSLTIPTRKKTEPQLPPAPRP